MRGIGRDGRRGVRGKGVRGEEGREGEGGRKGGGERQTDRDTHRQRPETDRYLDLIPPAQAHEQASRNILHCPKIEGQQ